MPGTAVQCTVTLPSEGTIDSISGGETTTIVNDFASLKRGVPLSVTRTVMGLVLGPSASPGVQVSTPMFGSMLTPAGAETRLNVNVFAGTSGSLAVLVTMSVVDSLM